MSTSPQSAAKGPNAREISKARTRERVLQAARQAIAQSDFETATIRGIARQAGLSTGAIFASFDGKIQLLEALVEQDRDAILQAMAAARDAAVDVAQAVGAMLRAHLDHYEGQTPMLKASLSLEWIRTPQAVAAALQATDDLREAFTLALKCGMERGELRPAINTRLVATLLIDISLAGLRRAALGDARVNIESCQALRVEMILRGWREPSGQDDSPELQQSCAG